LSTIPKELNIIGIVFLIFITLTPVLFFNNNYHLMAFFAKTTLVGGFGFGSVTCPNKLVFNNEQIQFQANKSKSDGMGSIAHATSNSSSHVSGFWTVGTLSYPHTSHLTLGPVKDLHLSSSLHKVVVKGIQQEDNICKSNNSVGRTLMPNDYLNITGQCGIQSRILVSSIDGIKGTFNGTIVCIAFR
jgi:hypothetical protein